MLSLQTACLVLAGLIAIAFGIKYIVAREFMAYHATVAGRPWADVPAGLQAIILGMYTIMGGGFITFGSALLWLLVPLQQRQAWAAIAVFTLTCTAILPVVFVTIWLRKVEPKARTPVIPALVVFVLALVACVAALFA